MFCPQCGQRQISNEARFCSGCGFSMNVVGELLANGGQLPWRPPSGTPKVITPRGKGIRQGAMLMVSTLLVVPLIGIIGVAMLGLPGEIAGAAAVICFIGGFLRILYALFLEENTPKTLDAVSQPAYVPPPTIPDYLGAPQRSATLPPAQSNPIQAPRPRRFDTGEIAPPVRSVTDHTTRLLDKQIDEQEKQ